MKENLFSIGELAELKGLPIKTLRFYDEIGLLKPYYTDPYTKYRYYASDQFIIVDLIKALRLMDISTKDITTILKDQDTNKLINFLKVQKERLNQRMIELENAITLIDTAKVGIEGAQASLLNTGVFYKHIEPRYAIVYPLDKINEKNGLMIIYSMLYKSIEQKDLINTYESGCLYQIEDSAYLPSQYYCIIQFKPRSNRDDLVLIRGGKYLCICFNKDNMEEQLTLLNECLKVNQYVPKQVLHVELLDQVFSDIEYYELQLLIEEVKSE